MQIGNIILVLYVAVLPVGWPLYSYLGGLMRLARSLLSIPVLSLLLQIPQDLLLLDRGGMVFYLYSPGYPLGLLTRTRVTL